MKRIAWLVLPLFGCILVWSVKWRADHPNPTKLDLEVRALMSKSSKVEVSQIKEFYSYNEELHKPIKQTQSYNEELRRDELTSLAESLYVSKQGNDMTRIGDGWNEEVIVDYRLEREKTEGVKNVVVAIDVNGREGTVTIVKSNRVEHYTLRPITVKRWIDFMFAHPRIGQKIREQTDQ